jgi:hypothetical protein
MNQPTRGEFDELKEEVRKLREQHTEPILVTVERRYPDRELLQEVSRKQDEHERLLIAHSRGINSLQNEILGARADITSIKATQSDHGEMLKDMATKADVSKLEADVSTLEARFGTLETRFGTLETRFGTLETIMLQILDRLP